MNRAIENSAFIFLLFLPIVPWIAYLSFLFLIYCFFYSYKFRKIKLTYYAYALLGGVALSCFFSTNKLISVGALAIFLCYFLSYVIFTNIVHTTAKKIVSAIVLSGIILAGIGIVLYFTKFKFVFEHEFVRIRLLPQAATLGNPNRFAKYLVLITPIAFASLLFTKDRVMPFIFMPMAFLSLWITKSLAGIIATFIALLIILWTKNKWIALVVLICGVGFYLIDYKKINKLTTSNRARVNTLKYIVPQIFRTYPITGCGIGTYKEVATKYDSGRRGLHYHAHNMYMHYLCETGILGLSTFLLFLIMVFRNSIKLINKRELQLNWVLLGGIASITGLLIHGIAETCIDYFQIGILFFSIIGIVAGIYSGINHYEFFTS